MKSVHIPENLDLKGILADFPPSFKFDEDSFTYLIGALIRLKTRRKDYLESDFIPMNAQVMQRKIRNYNHYLSYLIKAGIIETDGQWIKGKKSTGFKLTDTYTQSGYKIAEISKRSLLKDTYEERQKIRQVNENYGYLTRWFNKNLQIDRDGARGCLLDLYNKEQEEGLSNIKARERYILREVAIDKLNNGLYHLSVDDKGRRFYSNLTNLKSGLRKFITYAGRQLCSVDIKNSQPFISTILFNPAFYEIDSKRLTLYKLSPEIYGKVYLSISSIISIISSTSSSSSSIIMLVKPDETQCRSDLELYCTLVDKGRLYPYLSDQYFLKTGIKLDTAIPEQKGKLKEMIFITLFSGNQFLGQKEAELKRFFKELFPTVYKVFSIIKRKEQNLLPIILQLVESEIVLNRAAKLIASTNPEIPLFTIHDSIVTLEEYKEMVWGILKSEFEKALELKPSLAVEMWKPDSKQPIVPYSKSKQIIR